MKTRKIQTAYIYLLSPSLLWALEIISVAEQADWNMSTHPYKSLHVLLAAELARVRLITWSIDVVRFDGDAVKRGRVATSTGVLGGEWFPALVASLSHQL